MYNLLISYYFSILFDVLHEKFGIVLGILINPLNLATAVSEL